MSKQRKSYGYVSGPYGRVGGAPLTINPPKEKKRTPIVVVKQTVLPSLVAPQSGINKGVGNAAWAREMRRMPCHYCGGPGGTVDHVIPRIHGGRSVYENCVPACERCNVMRGAFKYEHFIAAIDYGMLQVFDGIKWPRKQHVARFIMAAIRVMSQRQGLVA